MFTFGEYIMHNALTVSHPTISVQTSIAGPRDVSLVVADAAGLAGDLSDKQNDH